MDDAFVVPPCHGSEQTKLLMPFREAWQEFHSEFGGRDRLVALTA